MKIGANKDLGIGILGIETELASLLCVNYLFSYV
jgi:hypothetical protein